MERSLRWQVGTASQCIEHFAQRRRRVIEPVVLYVRVSFPSQKENGNLDEEVSRSLGLLAAMGIEPINTFAGVEQADMFGPPPLLVTALACARQHGAVLVAPYRDRLIRSHLYYQDKECRDARYELPSAAEYRLLHRLAAGVPLATLLHPDSTGARGLQIRRGQAAKGGRGGGDRLAGYKKRRRRLNESKVLWLGAVGFSVRQIAAKLKAHPTQVQRWKRSS